MGWFQWAIVAAHHISRAVGNLTFLLQSCWCRRRRQNVQGLQGVAGGDADCNVDPTYRVLILFVGTIFYIFFYVAVGLGLRSRGVSWLACKMWWARMTYSAQKWRGARYFYVAPWAPRTPRTAQQTPSHARKCERALFFSFRIVPARSRDMTDAWRMLRWVTGQDVLVVIVARGHVKRSSYAIVLACGRQAAV